MTPGLYLLSAKLDTERRLMISLGDDRRSRTCILLDPRLSRYAVRIKREISEVNLSWCDGDGPPVRFRRLLSPEVAAIRLLYNRQINGLKFRIGPYAYAAPLKDNQNGSIEREIAYQSEQSILRSFDLADESNYLLDFPAIDQGWQAPKGAYRPSKKERVGRIGVVVHLHYTDLWPEIDACLRRIGYPFDLHVTLTQRDELAMDRIKSAHPRSTFHVMENRGRDVAPFIELLNAGAFDAYGYVLKIHGKMSRKNGEETLLGKRWRRAIFQQLLPDPVGPLLDRFDTHPQLGIIGPHSFRIPSPHFPEALDGRRNDEQVKALANRMGIEGFELDFFAGTMFWFRPQALGPLRQLGLKLADFPDEEGQMDGTLQHALERLFVPTVKLAGYEVGVSEEGANLTVNGPLAHAAGF